MPRSVFGESRILYVTYLNAPDVEFVFESTVPLNKEFTNWAPRRKSPKLNGFCAHSGYATAKCLPAAALASPNVALAAAVLQVTPAVAGVSVQELTGMEGEMITMQEIFAFHRISTGPDGKVIGEFRAFMFRIAARRIADGDYAAAFPWLDEVPAGHRAGHAQDADVAAGTKLLSPEAAFLLRWRLQLFPPFPFRQFWYSSVRTSDVILNAERFFGRFFSSLKCTSA